MKFVRSEASPIGSDQLVGVGVKRDADAIRKPTIVGNGCRFERIRRITGYLVGTLDRFCNSKRKEERDRVKHG